MTGPLLTHEVPGGAGWSLLLRAGRELVLTATGAGANCSTLVFPAHDPADRLNVQEPSRRIRSGGSLVSSHTP